MSKDSRYHVIRWNVENWVLKSKLPGGRVHLTDTERRRLAKLAHPLSRKQLRDTATIATPEVVACDYLCPPKAGFSSHSRIDQM